jgi:ATP-dependent helicase HrpB
LSILTAIVNLPNLPILSSLTAIAAGLQSGTRLVLQAPPGSGKSTVVPLALLNEPWMAGRKLLLLQPRRVAARTIAARMADLLGEEVGETVGYRVRFESRVSGNTRIEVLTEGILTRMIQDDPGLEQAAAVLFDEFHERSLHADLALALALDAQQTLRPELRILIMSATLDSRRLAEFLGEAEVVTGEGVPYPVDLRYLPRDPVEKTPQICARAVLRAIKAEQGDILVFLPGVAEIQQTAAKLQEDAPGLALEVLELYGDLPLERQREILLPRSGRRRVILSTPIAETSLTIEGIRIVIDSGWVKTARFDPNAGANRIVTERISEDSADQRAGRAGRLGPGICERLWSVHTQRTLRKQRSPEMAAGDLSSFALELAAWGVQEPQELGFLDLPPVASWNQAGELLRELGAVDREGRITALGKRLVQFPAHPRIAHMLLRAEKENLAPLACDIAAVLEERDLFGRNDSRGVDLELRLDALLESRKRRRSDFRRIKQRAEDWARRMRCELRTSDAQAGSAGLVLAFAYPERIAKHRGSSDKEPRYLLANGIGAKLSALDPLQKSEFLVAAHMQVGAGDGQIYLAAALPEAKLRTAFGERILRSREVCWDSGQRAVRAEETERLGALLLKTRTIEAEEDECSSLFFAGLRESSGVRELHWTREAEQLQNRLLCAEKYLPEAHLPDCSDHALNERLEQLLAGRISCRKRLDQLATVDACELLAAELSWDQRQQLDRLLPESLVGPDGKRRRLNYDNPDGPVLEATVQELLGWPDSPQLADGRVPLLLHILSPARRPLQITKDLRGFWVNTYPEVRKEFRGRYPKHRWPENPFAEREK